MIKIKETKLNEKFSNMVLIIDGHYLHLGVFDKDNLKFIRECGLDDKAFTGVEVDGRD